MFEAVLQPMHLLVIFGIAMLGALAIALLPKDPARSLDAKHR